MKKMIWTPSYSVGNDVLDTQHQTIINLINKLIVHQQSAVTTAAVNSILNDMLKYTREHLEYEEALLEKLNYPDISQHKTHHMNYQEQIVDLIFEATELVLKGRNQDTSISCKALEFLKQWWNDHILNEDMKYKPFLEENFIN